MTKPLRLPQFFGYAAGDAANNLAFSMSSMFLLIYYTDVVGISAAAVTVSIAGLQLPLTRVSGTPLLGTWQIDDVYVDPFMRR